MKVLVTARMASVDWSKPVFVNLGDFFAPALDVVIFMITTFFLLPFPTFAVNGWRIVVLRYFGVADEAFEFESIGRVWFYIENFLQCAGTWCVFIYQLLLDVLCLINGILRVRIRAPNFTILTFSNYLNLIISFLWDRITNVKLLFTRLLLMAFLSFVMRRSLISLILRRFGLLIWTLTIYILNLKISKTPTATILHFFRTITIILFDIDNVI